MPNSTTHRGIHITRAEVPGASYEWTHDETNAHGMAPDIETAIAQIDLHLGSPGPTSAAPMPVTSTTPTVADLVTVKPLEWEDFEGRGARARALLITSYLIARWSDGRFEISVSAPGYSTGFDGERFHPTIEAAKAAAQADYETRILAAIQPDPEPQPVEELDLVGGPPILDLPDLIAEGRKAHESLCRGFDGRGTSTRTLVGDLTAALARASALNTLPDGPDGEVV